MEKDIKIGDVVVTTETVPTIDQYALFKGAECIVVAIDPQYGYDLNYINDNKVVDRCGWAVEKVKYANFHGYNDIEPYEIIRFVTSKCIEIRAMSCVEDNWKPDWVPGGFSAICMNQHHQKWCITSDPIQPTIRIRRHCGKRKGWFDPKGRMFILSNHPIKFYDYNF